MQPIFIAQVLAQVGTAQGFGELTGVLFSTIGVTLGEFICNAVGEFMVQNANRGLIRHLRNRLFLGTMAQTFVKLEKIDRGELQNRIMMDTTCVGARSLFFNPLSLSLLSLSVSVSQLAASMSDLYSFASVTLCLNLVLTAGPLLASPPACSAPYPPV